MKRALHLIVLIALLAGVTAPFGLAATVNGLRLTTDVALGAPEPSGSAVEPNKFVCVGLPVLPGLSQCSAADAGGAVGKNDPAGSYGVKLDNDPAKGGAIIIYLRAVLSLLSKAVGIVVMIMLVLSGIQYIVSAGDSSRVKAAKDRLQNAIIALVLFLSMFAILTFIIPGGIL